MKKHPWLPCVLTVLALATAGRAVASRSEQDCLPVPLPQPLTIGVSPDSERAWCFEATRPSILRVQESGVSVEIGDGEIWWDTPGDGLGTEWAILRAGERARVRLAEASSRNGVLTVTSNPASEYREEELRAIEATNKAAQLLRLEAVDGSAVDGSAVAGAADLFADAEANWRAAGRPSLAAFSEYQRATVLREHDRFDAARPLYESCMDRFGSLADVGMEGRCANGLGLVQLELGDHDAALKSFEIAEGLSGSAGDDYVVAAAINNQCLILFHGDRLEEAEKCLERAIDAYMAAGQTIRSALPRFNLGAVRTSLLRLDEAEAALLDALNLVDEGVLPTREGQVLLNLAELQRRMGRYDEAEKSILRARELFDTLDRPVWEARALRELGFLHRALGHQTQAIAYFREALALVDPEKGNPKNRGLILLALSDLVSAEEAKQLRDRALEIFSTPGAELPAAIARVWMAEVEARLAADRLEEAQVAMDAFREAVGAAENPVLSAHADRLAGALALKRGAPREAVATLAGAHSFFLEHGLLSSALETAALEARALLADNRPEAALQVSRTSLELAQVARQAITSPRVRVTFDALYRQLVTGALSAWYAEYRAGGPGASAILDTAMQMALRHYNRGLREEAGSPAGGTPNPGREKLIAQLAYLLSWDREEPEVHDRNQLTQVLNRLQESAHRVQVDPAGQDVDIAALRDALGKRDALVLLHSGSRPHLFIISGATGVAQWRVVEDGRGFVDDVTGLVDQLARGPRQWDRSLTRRIGTAVLADAGPALATADRLWVIADGIAALMPWGMLDWDGRPLADRLVPIRVQMPLASAGREAGDPLSRSLVVNGFETPIDAEIAPLLAADANRVDVVSGAAASRERLLDQDLGRYSHLHFAAHGKSFADSRLPAMLRLPGSGGQAQSLLDAETIESWSLGADLVVLAACESAAGEVYSGEQPLGLERAFVAAGVGSVVSTLWRVEDRAAQVFSREFYRLLIGSGDIVGAYRGAVDALRSHRRWRDPHYWAAFTLSVRNLEHGGGAGRALAGE